MGRNGTSAPEERGAESSVTAYDASWKRLDEFVEERKFRQDLFYRIGGKLLVVPPLRERLSDIPLIAARFLSLRDARSKPTLSTAAEATLKTFDWPGNVRQLERVLELAAIETEGAEIEASTVRQILEAPGQAAAPKKKAWGLDDVPARLEAIERELMAEGLARAGGRWKRAARELGYRSVTTFYRRAQRYGLLPTKGGSTAAPDDDGAEAS